MHPDTRSSVGNKKFNRINFIFTGKSITMLEIKVKKEWQKPEILLLSSGYDVNGGGPNNNVHEYRDGNGSAIVTDGAFPPIYNSVAFS